jgi:membrane protein
MVSGCEFDPLAGNWPGLRICADEIASCNEFICYLLKKTASEWMEDDAPTLGAALAYYTIFSLAPLLTIAIAIAGFFFGKGAAQCQIFDELRGLIGEQSGKAVQEMVQNANAQPTVGIVATVVSVVMLLFGASGVFGQLQASLNRIWEVKPKPGRGYSASFETVFSPLALPLWLASCFWFH